MLRNAAYLVISSPAIGDADGVFEFRHNLELSSQLEKDYLVSNFGTALLEGTRYVGSDVAESLTGETVPERRQGFSLDAGGGTWGGSIDATTGLEDVRWGDGSGGDGAANVTRTDASGGTDVDPITRLQVLMYWLANTTSDSRGQARLHIGQWTDGSRDDYRDGAHVGVSAGTYGRPFPVAIRSAEPRSDPNDPSDTIVTVQYQRTQVADGVLGDVADWLGSLGDGVEDFISGDSSTEFPDA